MLGLWRIAAIGSEDPSSYFSRGDGEVLTWIFPLPM